MHQWFCHERSMGWKWRYRRWYGRDRVYRRAVRSGSRGFGLASDWRRRIHPFHSQGNEQAVNLNEISTGFRDGNEKDVSGAANHWPRSEEHTSELQSLA